MHSQAEHAVLKVLHVAAALQAPQPELGGWQAGGQEAACLRVDMATSNHLTTLRWPLSLLKNSEHPPIKSLDCFPPKTVGRLSFVLWQNYLSLCSTLCDKIIPEFSG